DARQYYNFMAQNNINKMFLDNIRQSIISSDKKKRGSGLGISVALPKRLDKIFGEGGAGLKVSGFRRVSFAGRSQWTDAAESETYRQNKFPSLRMEQISRFNITGTIGSKISVKVSQDSQTDIPLANRIQIRYKGNEDDILKVIEAGNTNLKIPNTKFVGYSSRIRGLFGLKAVAQVGNLTMTGIASQEKGSTERASFSATGEENAKYDRDYEYVMRRIFDLGRPGELARNDSVITLFIYETISGTSTDIEENFANLYVHPDSTNKYLDENIISGSNVRVKQIPMESYVYYNDPVRDLHYVVFNASRNSLYHLGYWMVVKRADGITIDTIGDISSSTYNLKLLSLSDTRARPEHQTWGLMWRNCYRIPKGVTVDDINVKIFTGLDGSEGTSSSFDYQEADGQTIRYLELLGLDQYNAVDKKVPDNILDDRQEVFRPDWGLIIFPDRKPFASDVLTEKVPNIYDYDSYSIKQTDSKYYIQTSTKTRSSIIKLNRANIIEGSERVTLNGRLLSKGTDYNIQYDFGQITLLTPEAADPNADINIDYEYAPFFAVQKKSLLGFRAEYEWSKDLKFGGTFLYKTDKAQERKPKIGQETARALVFDTDLSLKLHPNFLTKLTDALPLVETEVPSNISINAEIAQSHPNPNVNDEAFVDDFESALDQLSLGTSRTIWKRASMPAQLDSAKFVQGQLLWHSPRELVQVEDVYDRQAKQGEGTIRTLRLIYRPQNFKVDTTQVDSATIQVDTVAANSWAGMMRFFNSRVDAKRAQLFEVRARGNRGKLHFDFGRISEDLNGNGNADSEDKDFNEAVDEGEDVGLDGLPDSLETGYDPVLNPDPNGDNWYFQGEGKCPFGPGGCDSINWDDDNWYYEYLNGTEGNFNDPSVLGLPDQEVLSFGGAFDNINSYFSFVIDYASDSFLVENSEKNGWRTFQIPIRDSAATDGFINSPNWDQITHVRVWFESDSSMTTPDTIHVANWYFVQSNWQDSVIFGDNTDSSTTFYVASVSDEDNITFEPPPGVEAYRDPTDNVIEAQRALVLNYSNLDYQDTCLATKDLLSVDRYSGYRRLQMYVHGGSNPENIGKIKFFFRLGKNAANYY
ncbi:MAG: cell surface protein SprA, partial [Candidatus Zixiibacteriota bacterium]